MKKTIGFYISILAAVLAAVGCFFYKDTGLAEQRILIIAGAAIAVTVLMVILAVVSGQKKFGIVNLGATASAVILAWALVQSLNPQLDPLGWWVSGLYTYDQVKNYLFFAGFSGAAILLYIIASFINVKKAA